MSTLTQSLANLVCGFEAVPMPQEALDRSRHAVMDCVGVALAGSREPVSRVVLGQSLEAGGREEATVWGTAHRLPMLEAALVNGTMAHALDYDDMNRSMLGHPSAVLVPALFALGEHLRLPGRKLLQAYALGLEAMARLGRIFTTRAYEKSWHPTAVLGAMGACAAAGHLLRLTHGQMLNAIGIAASEASSVKKNFGSMTKALHAGSAVRKGLWAARLAQEGVTAGADGLDGTFGYMHLFDGRPFDAQMNDDADAPLEILRTGLVYKAYPCCGGLHSVVDNVLLLRERHGLRAEEVAEMECRVHPNKVAYLDRPHIDSPLSAKFSIQYCAATALLRGRVGLSEFADDAMGLPETRAVMKKIRVTGDATLGGFASEARVRNVDGREMSSHVPEPKGSASFPMTTDELLRKFIDCAMVSLSAARAEQAAARFMALEKQEDMREVLQLLVAD